MSNFTQTIIQLEFTKPSIASPRLIKLVLIRNIDRLIQIVNYTCYDLIFKGTVKQIEKTLTNDCFRVSKVS